MKLYEVLNLQSLYAEIKDMKLPLKTVYKFTRLMRRAEEETMFYQTEFQKIIDEFAQVDEHGALVFSPDGQSIEIKPGMTADCNKRIDELKNLEVDMGVTLTLDELEALSLTIAQMNTLLPLVVE